MCCNLNSKEGRDKINFVWTFTMGFMSADVLRQILYGFEKYGNLVIPACMGIAAGLIIIVENRYNK